MAHSPWAVRAFPSELPKSETAVRNRDLPPWAVPRRSSISQLPLLVIKQDNILIYFHIITSLTNQIPMSAVELLTRSVSCMVSFTAPANLVSSLDGLQEILPRQLGASLNSVDTKYVYTFLPQPSLELLAQQPHNCDPK